MCGTFTPDVPLKRGHDPPMHQKYVSWKLQAPAHAGGPNPKTLSFETQRGGGDGGRAD